MEELFLQQQEQINLLQKKVYEMIDGFAVLHRLHDDKNERIRDLERKIGILFQMNGETTASVERLITLMEQKI